MPPPSASEPEPAPIGVVDARGLVERFRRDLTTALGREPGTAGPIALAVSGGADSMAMLWLAVRAYPGRVMAASVDHRLRPDSGDEVALVARWCAGAGVPHAALAIATPPPPTGNRHAWARARRYELLTAWAKDRGAAILCTAHHADDQVETFLMRAGRGAGLSGLAAVRARRGSGEAHDDPPIVRPLLNWLRADLRAVCRDMGVPFADDPSNADPRYERVRFRTWLAQAPWANASGAARAVAQLAEVDADLTLMAGRLWQERARIDAPRTVRIDATDLVREMRRRLVRLALAEVGGDCDSAAGVNVERLLDALEAGEQAMQGDVLASASGTIWHFRAAPPRRSR